MGLLVVIIADRQGSHREILVSKGFNGSFPDLAVDFAYGADLPRILRPSNKEYDRFPIFVLGFFEPF